MLNFFTFFTKKQMIGFYILNVIFICAAVLDALTIFIIYQLIISFSNWNEINLLISDNLSQHEFNMIAIISILGSVIFRAFTTFYQIKFVRGLEYDIVGTLTKDLLNKNLEWLNNNNSNDIIKKLLNEVGTVVATYIFPLSIIISQFFLLLFISISLLFIDYNVTIYSMLFISSAYLLIFYFTRKKLKVLGANRLKYNKLRFISGSDYLNQLEEVLVNKNGKILEDTFHKQNLKFVKTTINSQIISLLPRYLIEFVVFILLIIYLIVSNELNTDNVALMITFIMASQKMLPAAQLIFQSISNCIYTKTTLDNLVKDYGKFNQSIFDIYSESEELYYNINVKVSDKIFKFKNIKIRLKKMNIIRGESGVGKSTLMKSILCLTNISDFNLLDGSKNYNEPVRLSGAYYVSQNSFLTDNSILENFKFLDKIYDMNYINYICKEIDIFENFGYENYDESLYNIQIGENGCRVSGGQRQRIIIVKCILSKPTHIFLDEAFSSLDSDSEIKILKFLKKELPETTIIAISHRPEVFKLFDNSVDL